MDADHLDDMIARLYAQLGQVAKAEEHYRTLRNLDANSPLLPQLATQIFATHNDTVKALKLEHAAVVDSKDDSAKINAVAKLLEAARRAALASGLDYLRNSPDPRYGVLWNSLQIARDLGEWQTVEEIGKKTIEAYGDSPQTADKVTRFVKPIVGESYLRRQRFREAVDLLTEVEQAVPTDYPVKRLLSLAQGGWFELSRAGSVVEVTGRDQPIPAYQRYWREYKKYALNPTRGVEKYTYPWYEFYYECFCLAKRASRADSKYKQTAETLYNIAKSFDNFDTLKNLGPDGESLFLLFQQVKSR